MDQLEVAGAGYAEADRVLSQWREQRRVLILKALAAGHTEREVAEAARCSPPYVNQLRNGR